jgi:hypothetical protein
MKQADGSYAPAVAKFGVINMSEIKIKCDLMNEGWNYDTCIQCKRFTMGTTAKGPSWRCSLNKASASEKRAFSMIWTVNYLVTRGLKITESTIIVEYVGKKKKGTKPLSLF